MLKYSTDDLDYFRLLKEIKKIDKLECSKQIRIAILSDCATQQIASVLKVLFYKNEIHAEIYEGNFDSIELEVFSPQSNLYAFDPDVVIIFNSTQKLKQIYYNYAADKSGLLESLQEKTVSIWEQLLQKKDFRIIQSSLVIPNESLFGNYDCKVDTSLYSIATSLNHFLFQKSQQYKTVFINDVDRLASFHGRKNWLNDMLWIHSKTPCSLEYIPYLCQNIVDIYLSSAGAAIKCVVLDLDNTLWGGVIGDDGLEGIALGHLGEGEAFFEIQQYFRELKHRGIILAVCSKNDYDNAIKPFREHPEMCLKEEDITVFIANWNNKADNIREIKETLNIGFDSLVFIDDSPYERNLVREFLPDVVVPDLPEDPAEYVRYISELNLFETSFFTQEDKSRADMYKVEFQRKNLAKSFTDINGYLQSLEMKITMNRFDEFNIPRIAQLIQRSNQFNLTTKRYSESECTAFMHDGKNCFPQYIKLEDKFGDYGLISVIILKFVQQSLVIDSWLMSCRVLSRGVEQYAMNRIFDFAKNNNLGKVVGEYIPSPKNSMVEDFYEKFGFSKQSEQPDRVVWSLETDKYKPQQVFLKEALQ